MAAILNFKIADIGTIEKNGTKSILFLELEGLKKNLGSKNVAEFLTKYMTAYTIKHNINLTINNKYKFQQK